MGVLASVMRLPCEKRHPRGLCTGLRLNAGRIPAMRDLLAQGRPRPGRRRIAIGHQPRVGGHPQPSAVDADYQVIQRLWVTRGDQQREGGDQHEQPAAPQRQRFPLALGGRSACTRTSASPMVGASICVYRCLTARADALFELADAVLCTEDPDLVTGGAV
jgi:hypothetical protein